MVVVRHLRTVINSVQYSFVFGLQRVEQATLNMSSGCHDSCQDVLESDMRRPGMRRSKKNDCCYIRDYMFDSIGIIKALYLV